MPGAECRKLLMNDEPVPLTKDSNSLCPDEVSHEVKSLSPITMPKCSTPEAHKKRSLSDSELNETFEKTPEAALKSPLKSPSSVLNPPSSLKRKTIRDYFIAAA